MIKIKLHLLIEHVFWIIHSDSRNKTKLPLLIGLVILAMLIPGSYLLISARHPGELPEFDRQYANFFVALITGGIYAGLSFLLALSAFPFSFFVRKKRICRMSCGILLLGSAGCCVYQGIVNNRFDRFTILTWGIFGALILLGIWTLCFLCGKAKQES